MSERSRPNDDERKSAGAPVPVLIERDGKSAVLITWSDQQVTRYTTSQLRDACPCATCREKRRGKEANANRDLKSLTLPVLSRAEASPLTIQAMKPVGTYAYSIAFSDGHSSGIYPFAMLRNLPQVDSSV